MSPDFLKRRRGRYQIDCLFWLVCADPGNPVSPNSILVDHIGTVRYLLEDWRPLLVAEREVLFPGQLGFFIIASHIIRGWWRWRLARVVSWRPPLELRLNYGFGFLFENVFLLNGQSVVLCKRDSDCMLDDVLLYCSDSFCRVFGKAFYSCDFLCSPGFWIVFSNSRGTFFRFLVQILNFSWNCSSFRLFKRSLSRRQLFWPFI